MPVVTGLLTLFIPIALFALAGSSRHLVVGADSATAAILIAGLSSLAVAGSTRYVALAEMAAILTGALLMVARIFRLGFVANFLFAHRSRRLSLRCRLLGGRGSARRHAGG